MVPEHCHPAAANLPRVSVGMDAGRPCDRRSEGRMPARVPMRQEVEFRFYEGRSEGPQKEKQKGDAAQFASIVGRRSTTDAATVLNRRRQ